MVVPADGAGFEVRSRLYFGSASFPRPPGSTEPTMGFAFHALLDFNRLYSRLLLQAARSRVLASLRQARAEAQEKAPMRTPIFQLDAFTAHRFAGNPAAVMPLDRFPEDALMQAIAAETIFAETAFLVPEGGRLPLALVHARHRSAALRTRHPGQRAVVMERLEPQRSESGLPFGQRPAAGEAGGHGLRGWTFRRGPRSGCPHRGLE